MGYNSELNEIKCAYANLQSFCNKKREIELYLCRESIDILFFTEVWLTEEHHSSEIVLPGFQTPIIDLNARGGACAFVKENLDYIKIAPPCNVRESVWFSMKTKDGVTRLYACVYRSPNSDAENNNNLLTNIRWARENFQEVIMIGDFNFPNIDWHTENCSNELSQNFVDCLNDNNLEQVIDQVTRYRHGQNPSLLDLLITSDPEITSNIIYENPFGKSDHVLIRFSVKNAIEVQDKTIPKFDFRKMNEAGFANKILSYNFEQLFENEDINESYSQFIEKVVNAMNDNIPIFKKNRRKNAPWANTYIRNLAHKKRNKWDKYKNSPTELEYNSYKNTLNRFNEEKEKAILNYENGIIASKNSNPKKFYNYVSRKNKYGRDKICLKIGDDLETDETKCANALNEYFGSVFTTGPSISVGTTTDNNRYIEMPEITINLDNVVKKLNEIDANKSTGPDGIPGYILKKFSHVFAPILTKLFRKSYNNGIVPAELKTANVVPLFKCGDRLQPQNYRPISLTPIIAKIFEGIFHDALIAHTEINSIICPEQHGFLKGRSTNTNLISFWNDITLMAKDTKEITIIYTDAKKAFDSVPHDLLLHKCQNLGITGKNLAFIRSFLSDREQRVSLNNTESRKIPIKSGVPQGGVLSGLLFILYVNDLPQCLQYLKASIYADDAKFYGPTLNPTSEDLIQKDLNEIARWCEKWRIRLHEQKCFALHYKPRFCTNPPPQYYINDSPLPMKHSSTDLGVIICDNLRFKEQIAHSCKKLLAKSI